MGELMHRPNIIWTRLRGSLWFIPGLMILGGALLAFGLIYADSAVERDWLEKYPRLFGLGADGSRGMLTAIAGSMLTVAALAFSLTLNSITQASSQYTPRILRNFMRDRTNQFVLGYFVSVFVYCLIVLRTIRGDDPRFVPSLGVMAGLVLAIGGVLVLIFFIHHITDSLQLTTILDRISYETKKAAQSQEHCSDQEGDQWPTDVQAALTKVRAQSPGYMQSINLDAMVKFAAERDLTIRVERGIGQFAGSQAVLARIARHPAAPPAPLSLTSEDLTQVHGMFALDRERTIEQDVGFGIRQIVDIALKALSPGVNDTTTAISCIDHLGEILGEIGRLPPPRRQWKKDGLTRVLIMTPDFTDHLRTAFDQVRDSGRANLAIFLRMLSAMEYLGEQTSDAEKQSALVEQLDLLAAFANQTLETEHERQAVRSRLEKTRAHLPQSEA